MTGLADWAGGALLGSTLLMIIVLAARGQVRRWLGSRPCYLLWSLPTLRLIVPPLPARLADALPGTGGRELTILFAGSGAAPPAATVADWPLTDIVVTAWLAGGAVLLTWQIARYLRFRRGLAAAATSTTWHRRIRVIATAVDGPVAFGIFRPTVAVPHDFADRYDARERRLVLAHEFAHHARRDLIANWASLVVLAVHWWNPIAWIAVRAFRDDQEFAVDADVLAQRATAERSTYARVLARAAGLGALPACNLTPKSNLKGRLMMLSAPPLPRRRLLVGGGGLGLAAVAVFAATVSVTSAAAPPAGRQAVTIGVKPDGSGGYALIVGGAATAPGAPLTGGATLPSDFSPHGGCDLKPAATPRAMVIKGFGNVETYTVMCASAAPAPVRATLAEGLVSLKTMRGSIAAQPASTAFPESERRYALGKVDRSIREVEATMAKAG